MTDQQASTRILGSLAKTSDGKGVIRIEDRFDTSVDDLWSALTDPKRLARWYGDFEGDLHAGGDFRARIHASGWEGTGHVDACEPPHRFVITTRDPDVPYATTKEVTLTAVGDQTLLVVEHHGMPIDLVAAYGAGLQIHVEDLERYIAGLDRVAGDSRWDELSPHYDELAAKIQEGDR